MEKLKLWPLLIFSGLLITGCISKEREQQQEKEAIIDKIVEETQDEVGKVTDSLVADLKQKGYQLFDYIDEKTGERTLMQQYFVAFLKRGPKRSQSKEEADSLQRLHLEHLGRMYYDGYASISGPFGDDGDIRGITIYNTPTLEMADSLANMDPSVKAGRLVIEMHPWWAAKGFPLK